MINRLLRLNSFLTLASIAVFLFILQIPVTHASQYHDLLKRFQERQPATFYSSHIISKPVAQRTAPSDTSLKNTQKLEKQFHTPEEKQVLAHHFFTADSTISQYLTRDNHNDKFSNLFAKNFTLDTFLAVVAIRNPLIQAAQNRVEASRQSIRQAANLDAILMQYAAFSESLANKVGPMKDGMVQEKFPFPALASLKGRIAKQNVLISLEEQEITTRTVLTTSQKQFWDLLYNREAQKLTTEMIHLMEHLETVARSRYETGSSGFQELILVQITLESLKERQITLAKKQKNIEVNIRQLMDLADLPKIGTPKISKRYTFKTNILPESSLTKLNQLGQELRQELRIERTAITRMELLIDLAESMILPPFTLNLANFTDKAILQVGSDAPMKTFQTGIKAQKGAGLPKAPWFGSNDAFLEKTRHLLAARKAELHNMELETNSNIREKWFAFDKARRDEVLYRTKIVDLSESALHVVTKGYETGATPFSQVNQSYQNWLNSRLALAKSTSAVGIAISRLTESLGTEDFQQHD